MRDITPQETIRQVLSESIPKDKWLHITDIYKLFEQSHKDFRPDDFLPLADYNSQEQWKRNIRVALRQFKLRNLILWNGNEKYLFPGFDEISNEEIPSLTQNSGISEQKFWEQLERKRIIGIKGEEFVVEYEKQSLLKLNLIELAEKVKRVSDENVANGYDVISYSPDGQDKFIEVKTTITSKYEFEISSNELKRAKQLSDNYFLYFIRNFNADNNNNEILIYNYLQLENNFEMIPCSFKAKLKK
ncbi:MAG: DUF3883 domain-containing protein [Daejeonella sp.]